MRNRLRMVDGMSRKTKTDRFVNADPRLWGTPEQEAHMDKVCGGTRSQCAQRSAKDWALKQKNGWFIRTQRALDAARAFDAAR